MARILLVEDEEFVRDCLCQKLLQSGYIVHEATGATALTVLEQCGHGIDILITDVVMPKVNGVDVAVAILQKHPGIPIIFISGYGEEIMARYPEAPKAVFLEKPFLPSQLARVVATLLTLRSPQNAQKLVLVDPETDRREMQSFSSGACNISPGLTARYCLDELDNHSRDLYEEHFFACTICAERVRQFSEFLDILRVLLGPFRIK